MTQVTIITNFFNTAKYLEETVQSVLGQTYGDWELLLVDDGSSDDSTGIAQKYVQQYPKKIFYLEHPGHQNGGISAARNLGLRHARGEYIAMLDSDDVWLSHKLERQLKIFDLNPKAVMAYGPVIYWHGWTGRPEDTNRDRSSPLGVKSDVLYEPPFLSGHYLRNGGCVPATCSTVMVRKNILKDIGGFREDFPIFEDQILYTQIALNYPVYVDHEMLVKYRQHPESACYKAEEAGFYSSKGKPNRAEEAFLEWVSDYIGQKGINDPKIKSALQKRKFPYEHPMLYRFIPELRKFKNSLRMLL